MLEEIKAALEQVKESLKGTVTADVMESKLKEMEQKLLQQIPKEQPSAIHDMKNQDRQQLVKQLKFIMGNSAKDMMRPGVESEAKALSVAVGADGGFLVPEEFRAEIQRKLIKKSVIRPQARVFTGVGKKGTIPRETGTVGTTWEGENVATAETTNPTFGSVAWNLSKLKGLTKVPVELLGNSAIDVLDLLSDMFAEAFEVEEDKVFMNGSGSLRPLGLRQVTTGMGTVAQAGANLDYNDLVKIKHTLKSQYRAEAVWLIHNDIISLIARIKDSNGLPLFLPPNTAGGPGITKDVPPQTIGWILGNPVLEQNDIPVNLGGGTNESEIWYTALRRGYLIFDQGTMEMSSTTEGFGTFESDQMAVKLLEFVDGKAGIPEASAFLSGVK